tara:strand:- start:289 stop:1371 length:1083 start_codon:yes stop_codon:yes gene_type:complete
MESSILKTFKNKKVIVTGNSGFKGSWLCQWLLLLEAKVIGISLNTPTTPSHFKLLKHKNTFKNYNCDVTNTKKLLEIFQDETPDFVFHLAAQSLVKKSISNPLETFLTNSLGTVSVLDVLRIHNKKVTCVMITSDKVYKNVEWLWGYKESDEIGGYDPYSASKGMAELALNSYIKTFFKGQNHIRIGIARAGNVIGGGDWAPNRLVPDTVKSWSINKRLLIRQPHSTRPWQHVLDPLFGYMKLAINLFKNKSFHGEAYNFGPFFDQNVTVIELIKLLSNKWGKGKWIVEKDKINLKEANLLKLNSEKAFHKLNWKPVLQFEKAINFTAEWYLQYYFGNKKDIYKITNKQINEYMRMNEEI